MDDALFVRVYDRMRELEGSRSRRLRPTVPPRRRFRRAAGLGLQRLGDWLVRSAEPAPHHRAA